MGTLLFFGACVTPTPVGAPVGDPPICDGEADCKAKWEAAQLFVVKNSDQKIQVATEVLIETYGPTRSTNIAMRVTKEPLGGGRYRIVAAAYCSNMFGCRRPIADVIRDFNASIKAVIP